MIHVWFKPCLLPLLQLFFVLEFLDLRSDTQFIGAKIASLRTVWPSFHKIQWL